MHVQWWRARPKEDLTPKALWASRFVDASSPSLCSDNGTPQTHYSVNLYCLFSLYFSIGHEGLGWLLDDPNSFRWPFDASMGEWFTDFQ